MKTQLWLFKVRCIPCGHEYQRWLVQSVDDLGGVITPSNFLGVLSYFQPPFREAAEIFYRQRGDPGKKSRRNVDDYAAVVGEICDPAPDETRYALDRYGSCPICGNFDEQSGVPVVPYQFRDAEVPPVAFGNWEKLSPNDREALIMQLSAEVAGKVGS